MQDNRKQKLMTFNLSASLHDQIKIMSVLTHKNMGEFIRISVMDKIKQLKEENGKK